MVDLQAEAILLEEKSFKLKTSNLEIGFKLI